MSDILVHVPEYGVAICSTCRYAVQPAGLSKHLLRHGVYRNERYAQVERFRKLKLLEPEDVPVPPPHSNPIPKLPVHQGRKCLAEDCSYICISEKRMQQHWRLNHDNCAVRERQSHLQTFFKGNKVQYFEVKHSGNDGATNHSQRTIRARRLRESRSACKVDGAEAKPSTKRGAPEKICLSSLDLDAMKLMHHCTVSTCLSLDRATESAGFLRTIIAHEAFNHDYLLYALLSFAALHLATIMCDADIIQKYRKLSSRYQALGLPKFREALSNPSVDNANALVMCSRVTGVHSLVDAHFKWKDVAQSEDLNPEEAIDSILSSLILLRGTVSTRLGLQPLLPQDSEFLQPQQTAHDMRRASELIPSLDMSCLSPLPSAPSFTSTSLEHLTVFGRDSLAFFQDRFDAITPLEDPKIADLLKSAFETLKESLEQASFATHLSDLWNALEMWPCMLPMCFTDLLASRHPSALLMYAHWLLIITKLEPHYWFLEGQPKRLLHSTASLLDKSDLCFLPQLV